jgi:hypothetical protein
VSWPTSRNSLPPIARNGTLTGDATEPAWNGYLLTVACPCGVVFERWIRPEEAELDLLRSARLS